MPESKSQKVIVGFVLDMSGSMGSVRDSTISGFNEYLDSLKENEDANIKFCLTVFNSEKINVKRPTNISSIKKLNVENYVPNALTPLYDAIAAGIKAVDDTGEDVDKILFVVMTDGLENHSVEYRRDDIFKMIKQHEDEQGWDFVYLGANQDAYAVGQQLGTSAGYTAPFVSTPDGITTTFSSLNKNTQTYVAASTSPTKFFDEEDEEDSDGVLPAGGP